MIIPRPYQVEAVDSTVGYFARGNSGNPLIAMPMGTGKSLIPPLFIAQAMRQWPNSRFLLLTHVKELIRQNAQKMLEIWPTAPLGIYSAGLGRKEAFAPIVFGGIASARNKIAEIGHRDILFVDEAHLISPNEESMYQQTIAELKAINPYLKVIGLTATPFRMGQGYLTDGGIFSDICYDITGLNEFNKLIDDCYLTTLVPKSTSTAIDISSVSILANDYNQKELAAAVDKIPIMRSAIEETLALAHDRQSWMVFGAGLENCEHLTDMLNAVGVAATVVHSKLDDQTRDDRIEAFKQGRFRAIVSNNILTTGFDHPKVDCIVDLRPTTSIVLHVQKYGRGTRPYYHPAWTIEQLQSLVNRKAAIEAGGKKNCLVLDFAGNVSRLGPINDPRVPKKRGKGTGEVPMKLCPACNAYNHTTARICCGCGKEFLFKVKIRKSASTEDIVANTDSQIEILQVDMVTRSIHRKADKPPSLKVSYLSGYRIFNVWLCFEGTGYPKKVAADWWRQHFGDQIPQSTQEAYDQFPACRLPRKIRVDSGGKYSKVLEYVF